MERQSLKDFIKNKYGDNVLKSINEYQKASKKEDILSKDIEFLSNCKRSSITPIHCRIGGRRSVSPTTRKLIGETERKLLNRSIVKNYTKRFKLLQTRKKIDCNLEEKLS